MSIFRRQAGLLLHPTSLPGPYGIGDLGPGAIKFLDWMKAAGFGLWQVLPVGPTGYGDSPYQCFSAFAGNPFLVSPDLLVAEGLLARRELKTPDFPADGIDYGWVIHWKTGLLRTAFANYRAGKFPALRKRLAAFRRKSASWLEDYALFAALKAAHGGAVWNTWAKPLRSFDKRAVAAARRDHAEEIDFQAFIQFLFHDQWDRVRGAARERGITIVGDMPIYVAYDSADTWTNQKLFKLKADGSPTHVAGVPPDYFSKTGQLWGNPIYRWDRMKADKFRWWVARFRALLDTVDIVRLDHFRGFEAYWEVTAGEPTAEHGMWRPGPREALFAALSKALGKDLPIIAENLGVITDEVEALREKFGMPGMKVLQFAWGTKKAKLPTPDPTNGFHPHKIEPTSVVYTGTHDNPTTVQWWNEFASPQEKALFQAYLHTTGAEPHKDLIRAALASVGRTVLIPAQDLLGIGAEGRMNFPGREAGNWGWRLKPDALTKELAAQTRATLTLYERVG